MKDREKMRRFPLWLSKTMGIIFLISGLLFTPGVWYGFQYSGFTVETVYTAVVWILSFAIGLALLCAKKGLPRTWHDTALLFKQTREEPDGLSEALPPEERIEHLKIMLEQGVLSQKEYEEKRKEIQQGL